ncbi:hypothetical protein ACVWWN_008406 [Mycobacterium sp. URHB0021]
MVQIDTQQLPSAGTGSNSLVDRNKRSRRVCGDATIFSGDGPIRPELAEGLHIFVDALKRFAEQSGNPRLTPIVAGIAQPVRIAVRGRDGVGRATVAAALAAAGVPVTTDVSAADVEVVVIAEALKPEDVTSAPADRPVVMVLNKADLVGLGADGPLARANQRAAACRALTGRPTVAMIAPLAVAVVDEDLMAALKVLVAEPADLTSTDAFVQTEHRLPSARRRRLLETLDRFGIAHAVLAIGDGADATAMRALLQRLSQVDRVVAQVHAAGAPVRYRRLRVAIAELHRLAVQSADESLMEFLSTDRTVLDVMSAAVDVVEAAGLTVDRDDDAAAHLRRAVRWQHYSRGPVDTLHRSCGADICRGSLRLLGQAW